jgi:hypothetical protein
MSPRSRLPGRLGAGSLLLTAALTGLAPAQPNGPPAAGAPALNPVVPLGVQRGTAHDITLTGANLADPLAVWLGGPGRINLAPDDTTGKDSTKIHARVEVPADASLGLYRLRVATAQGLSNFRPFCVDALPQIIESDNNHSPATAQGVSPPCVVVGRVDAEASDFFRFTAAAGQRLSFEVLGRRLGSALDPILRLHDARTGRELPRLYSDDAPGLQTDARLTHTFAAAGNYLVEIRDTTHKGGPDYWYRLRLGDFPCAVTPLPLAAPRGRKVTVDFAGPQVEGVAPVEFTAPTDPAVEAVGVTPVGPGGVPGWPVSLLLSDHEELRAGPEHDAPEKAFRLPVPCGVTGRFLRKSQRDHFAFAAKKGLRYTIAAQTVELHSPADVYLTLKAAGGSELAHSDPQRDPRIDFTAPADGDFFVLAEHLNYAFGPSEVYRLTVTPAAPGFELALASDRVDVPQGQLALIPVQSLTRYDYPGPIELSVVGHPGLSGTVTVPANVQAPPPAAGQPVPPPFLQLPVRAAADVPPGAYEVKIQAKAVIDGKDVLAFASTKAAVQQQMAGLPFPPREWLRGVGVAVTPKPPFILAARYELPEAVRGLSAMLVVTAARDPGFDGEIALAAAGLPPNVAAAPKPIAKGQTEAAIDLKVGEKAGLGSFAYSVVGRAQHEDRHYASTLLPPPLAVVLPFELKVEPNPVALDQGGKATLTVTAARKGGYGGPIALELRNLPAQVKATKATISPGQSSTALELAADAGAPLGSRGDVDVLGTAPPGNQQAPSPPFTVKVQAPPPALALKAEPAALTLKPGAKAKLKVTVERKHFAGPVALAVEGLPAKVTAAPATVAPDQTVAEVELTAAADAPDGKVEATVTGKGAATGAVMVRVVVEK